MDDPANPSIAWLHFMRVSLPGIETDLQNEQLLTSFFTSDDFTIFYLYDLAIIEAILRVLSL
jgi:hypothetical protein